MPKNPLHVVSPKKRLRHGYLLQAHISNAGGGETWSLAIGLWDGTPALLMRWDGEADRPSGTPSAHGHATWFVVPQLFYKQALTQSKDLSQRDQSLVLDWLNDAKELSKPPTLNLPKLIVQTSDAVVPDVI